MKKTILAMVMFCCLALVTAPAWAMTISLEPTSSIVAVGDSFNVNLVVSNVASEGVGGFWVDVTYDSSILSITDSDVTFGTSLGTGPDVDTFVDTTSISGLASVSEISFLDTDTLLSLQSASFTLAALTFTADGPGTSNLGYDYVDVSDAFGYTVYGVETADGKVTATPIPGAIYLFGTGLIGLVGFGRKRFNRA